MLTLSKLTIVVLTYDRPLYALRTMGLWSGTGASVHVLDGSGKAIAPVHLRAFSSNIHYHHLPVSIFKRIAEASNLVETEYVAFLADDDFFLPSALEKCILELEHSPALVACCGRQIGKLLAADLTVRWSAVQGLRSSHEGGHSSALEMEDPLERVLAHFSPYSPSTIYSVCRSDAWIKATQVLSTREFSSGVALEVQFELLMSFQGKTKVIEDLMWLRSAENDSHTTGFELAFHTWFSDKRYGPEVDDFLTITAKALAAGALSPGMVRHGLEQACGAYVASCNASVNNASSEPSLPTIKPVLSWSALDLPKRLIRRLSSRLPAPICAALPERFGFRPYVEIAKQLETAGVHVDWEQLNVVLESVRSLHAR